jgi:RecJ-like exonuclease
MTQPGGYSPERCATCKGSGSTEQGPCPACEGKGTVAVLQPPISCPRCKGTGKPTEDLYSYLPYCVVCRGTGWVRVLQP